jgi:serine/threonine protein kinase
VSERVRLTKRFVCRHPHPQASSAIPVNASLGKSLSSSLEHQAIDIGRWELEANEVEIGRELGSGAFGTVFRGKMRGKDVAIKKLNVQQFDDDTLAAFKQEVAIMRYDAT